MHKKYLVQIKIDNIQDFLFGFLANSQNSKNLRSGKYYSEIIENITNIDIKTPKKQDNSQIEKLLFTNFLKNAKITIEDIILNISGKVLIVLSGVNYDNFKKSFIDLYGTYLENNVTLIFNSQEIINDEIFEAYNKLQKTINSPRKNNETLQILNQNNDNKTQYTFVKKTQKNNPEIQAVVLLEKLEEQNKIAIIKGDLNNIGKMFTENVNSIKDLQDNSEKFNKVVKNFVTFFESNIEKGFKNKLDAKLLYFGGDDIFIISKIPKIIKIIQAIEENLVKKLNKNALKNNFKKGNEITIGVGILTVNHKAIFRYYLPRVEQLMEEAKEKAKNNEHPTNYLSINGQLIKMNSLEKEFGKYFDFRNKSNQSSKRMASKLHSVLEILEKNESIEDALYILTKDKIENDFAFDLAIKLIELIKNNLNITQEIKKDLEQRIRNFLLFSKYSKSKNSFEIKELKKISKSWEIDQKCFEIFDKLSYMKTELSGKLEIRSQLTKNKALFNPKRAKKGFWFTLLVDKLDNFNENELIIFLSNYQYNNKNLVWYQKNPKNQNKLTNKEKKLAENQIKNNINEMVKQLKEEKNIEIVKKACKQQIIKINIERLKNGKKKNNN